MPQKRSPGAGVLRREVLCSEIRDGALSSLVRRLLGDPLPTGGVLMGADVSSQLPAAAEFLSPPDSSATPAYSSLPRVCLDLLIPICP